MRKLATFCFAFAAAVFASQYLLSARFLFPAAAICAVLGVLWALAAPKRRLRVMLCVCGVCAALCWDGVYRQTVSAPYEMRAGEQAVFRMEACDYPSMTERGCRVEVRILGEGLRGRAVYYGGEALSTAVPGTRWHDTVTLSPSV